MENQVIHESALITQKNEIHKEFNTLLDCAKSEKSEIVENIKMELNELKWTLAASENQLNEQIIQDFLVLHLFWQNPQEWTEICRNEPEFRNSGGFHWNPGKDPPSIHYQRHTLY